MGVSMSGSVANRKQQDIHQTAIIGDGTKVWSFVYIGEYTTIGRNCVIANFVHIDRDVTIGDDCTIQGMVYIPEYTRIGNNCLINPCVCLINEKYPPSRRKEAVVIKDNCIVGSGSVISAGVKLGEGCVVGAGSLVLEDVQARTVVFGSPAHPYYSKQEYEKKKKQWDKMAI